MPLLEEIAITYYITMDNKKFSVVTDADHLVFNIYEWDDDLCYDVDVEDEDTCNELRKFVERNRIGHRQG